MFKIKARQRPNHRVYIDGKYIKVRDRTLDSVLDAAQRGALVVQDQSYFRPGFDRRRYDADGKYIGMPRL